MCPLSCVTETCCRIRYPRPYLRSRMSLTLVRSNIRTGESPVGQSRLPLDIAKPPTLFPECPWVFSTAPLEHNCNRNSAAIPTSLACRLLGRNGRPCTRPVAAGRRAIPTCPPMPTPTTSGGIRSLGKRNPCQRRFILDTQHSCCCGRAGCQGGHRQQTASRVLEQGLPGPIGRPRPKPIWMQSS